MVVEPDHDPGTTRAVPSEATDDVTPAANLVSSPEELTRQPGDAAPMVVEPHGRGGKQRHKGRGRRILAGFLVVLFSIFLPVTVIIGWAHYTVLNTDGYMKAVGPIASDPAVTAAISTQVTNQIFTALDAQTQVADALPPKADFLAGPITNGAKGYVQSAVDKVLQSDQFQNIWNNANEFAHEQLVKVLSESPRVS